MLSSDVAVLDDFDMSYSESEEEQELEVQYWRKERHYREMYLESVRVSCVATYNKIIVSHNMFCNY